MAKSKQQKQKDREKRVAKKKHALASKRRELAKKAEETSGNAGTGVPRAKKVIADGIKQAKPQVQSGKPIVTHRRAGG